MAPPRALIPTMRQGSTFAVVLCALAAGCAAGEGVDVVAAGGVDVAAIDAPPVIDAGGVDVPSLMDSRVTDAPVSIDAPAVTDRPAVTDGLAVTDVASTDVPVAVDVPETTVDDAAITEVAFPRWMGCTASVEAIVSVRNTGTSTWTDAAGYALGGVDDSDPLHPGEARVRLPDGVSVAPGETHTFAVRITAPGSAGRRVTDWRMVREHVRWFGETTTNEVSVQCDDAGTDSFRLADVTVVSSPDVRGFAVTSRLTSVAFRPGTIHVDHERRGAWPAVTISDDGTTQEATIWVFFRIDGRWYATGAERLRPNQTDKALDNPSSAGHEWLYDPGRWGEMTNYVPAPGELVGFMVVAGSTRSDDHVIARERTGAVLIRFPRDGEETSYPPFAWQE